MAASELWLQYLEETRFDYMKLSEIGECRHRPDNNINIDFNSTSKDASMPATCTILAFLKIIRTYLQRFTRPRSQFWSPWCLLSCIHNLTLYARATMLAATPLLTSLVWTILIHEVLKLYCLQKSGREKKQELNFLSRGKNDMINDG